MMRIVAYTDGACSGNPGPGGWGVLLCAYEGEICVKELELFGGEAETTNNRMELTAAIEALKVLRKPSSITIMTDSLYVRDGMTKWIETWKQKQWKLSTNKAPKNVELWQGLDFACSKHDVTWEWVKGHAGHPGNERADRLANKGMNAFKVKT